LRNTEGDTVCPYLLSLKCLNCGLSGHTISYCKVGKVGKVGKVVTVEVVLKPIFCDVGSLMDYDDDMDFVYLDKKNLNIFEPLKPLKPLKTIEMFKDRSNSPGSIMDPDWTYPFKSLAGVRWADICDV